MMLVEDPSARIYSGCQNLLTCGEFILVNALGSEKAAHPNGKSFFSW